MQLDELIHKAVQASVLDEVLRFLRGREITIEFLVDGRIRAGEAYHSKSDIEGLIFVLTNGGIQSPKNTTWMVDK